MFPSTDDLLVLQGLRLKGFIALPELAIFVGLSAEVVADRLETAAEDGFTRFRDGTRSGWSLTTEGRKEGERLLAVELDEAGLRHEINTVYQAFLPLNTRLLDACTRWQITDLDAQILNDHQDQAYDASIIARLHEIDAMVQPICAELQGLFVRFASYGPRLTTALTHIDGGDTAWFTKPTIDSYHTVWFELHEDLLATLGIDRAAEHA